MTKETPTSALKRPVTIHDVAGALGLHKSTVSLALSGKGNLAVATRERIIAMSQKLGYEPNPLAQRLAFGVSNNVVYIFSGVLDVGLATEKILIIQRELNARSLEVPIYTCGEIAARDDLQAAEIKQLCRQWPRAVICAAHTLHASVLRELEAYQRGGGIVVAYDVALPLDCDQVIFDREHNAYLAARRLLECGHRDIGIGMSHPGDPHELNEPQIARLQGFRRALDEFGAPFHEEWFFKNPTYEKGGAAMAQAFLKLKKRPTALCIVNDYVALAFMVEMLRAGVKVPGDVSIIGHDNQPIAEYCPVPLTCVSQPVEDIARKVVELLLQRLDGDVAPPRIVSIRGELVERQSVAAPFAARN